MEVEFSPCPNCSTAFPRAAASCPGCGLRRAAPKPPFPWLKMLLALLLALPVLPLGVTGAIMALYGTQEPGIQNRAELYIPGFLCLGLSGLLLLGSVALLVSALRRRLAPGASLPTRDPQGPAR